MNDLHCWGIPFVLTGGVLRVPRQTGTMNGCLTRAELNVEGLTLGQVLAQMQVFLTSPTRVAAYGEAVGSRGCLVEFDANSSREIGSKF